MCEAEVLCLPGTMRAQGPARLPTEKEQQILRTGKWVIRPFLLARHPSALAGAKEK